MNLNRENFFQLLAQNFYLRADFLACVELLVPCSRVLPSCLACARFHDVLVQSSGVHSRWSRLETFVYNIAYNKLIKKTRKHPESQSANIHQAAIFNFFCLKSHFAQKLLPMATTSIGLPDWVKN